MHHGNEKKQLITPDAPRPQGKPAFWPILGAFALTGAIAGFLVGVSRSPVVAPFLTAASGVGAGLCVVWFSRKKDEEQVLDESERRNLAFDVSAFATMAFIGLFAGAELRTGAITQYLTSEKPLNIKEYVATSGRHLGSEDVAKLLLLQALLTANGIERNALNNSLRVLVDETDDKLKKYEEQTRIADDAFVKKFLHSSKAADDELLQLEGNLNTLVKAGNEAQKALAKPTDWRGLQNLLEQCEKCRGSISGARNAFAHFGAYDDALVREYNALETNKLGKPTAIDDVLSDAIEVFRGNVAERSEAHSGIAPSMLAPVAPYRSPWTDLWSAWDNRGSHGAPAPAPAAPR